MFPCILLLLFCACQPEGEKTPSEITPSEKTPSEITKKRQAK